MLPRSGCNSSACPASGEGQGRKKETSKPKLLLWHRNHSCAALLSHWLYIDIKFWGQELLSGDVREGLAQFSSLSV